MEEALDMSLDDIIRKNKKSSFAAADSTITTTFTGRGHGRGTRGDHSSRRGRDFSRPVRRFPNRDQSRPTPYFTPQAVNQMQEFLIGGDSDSETKLYVSNLDFGVTNDDIKVLFSEIGELRRYSVHYDKSGRSKGTAEVDFARQSDAFAAMKRYNNIKLDGKPMKIEMVGVKMVTPAAITMPSNYSGTFGNSGGPFRRQEKVAGRGHDHGGNGGGRGPPRGSGRGGRGRAELSTEDLDADLDKYHQEAMQIN